MNYRLPLEALRQEFERACTDAIGNTPILFIRNPPDPIQREIAWRNAVESAATKTVQEFVQQIVGTPADAREETLLRVIAEMTLLSACEVDTHTVSSITLLVEMVVKQLHIALHVGKVIG